jgi:DNA-binding NtrC family response regulator
MHFLSKVPEYSIAKFPILPSTAMLGVWKLIGRAAASTSPVLITGEPGSGQELVARAIHECSPRSIHAFIGVNVTTLPPTLAESELFGQDVAAFIGAPARARGCFEAAREGTLLLDEIGDLDPASQTRLLRVVQEGSYEILGDSPAVAQRRARLIAATSRPIRPGIIGAPLREDLYYGLAAIEIELPPLRTHLSDIPLLVAHALRGTPARAVSEEAMQFLLRYPWPGNLRELCNVVARAAASCSREIIDLASLPEAVRQDRMAALAPDADATRGVPLGAEDLSLHVAIARLERQLILRALDRAQGNRSAAARFLGVNRPLLYAKMEEHGINGHSRESIDAKDRVEKELPDARPKEVPEAV